MKIIHILLFSTFLFFLSSENKKDYNNFIYLNNSFKINFIKSGELTIKNKNVFFKKIDIELLSKNSINENNGLKYRSSLNGEKGFLLILNNQNDYINLNLDNIKIPLDLIFINQNNEVVHVEKAISPIRGLKIKNLYKMVKYILEIKSGKADEWGIKVGESKINFFV